MQAWIRPVYAHIQLAVAIQLTDKSLNMYTIIIITYQIFKANTFISYTEDCRVRLCLRPPCPNPLPPPPGRCCSKCPSIAKCVSWCNMTIPTTNWECHSLYNSTQH